MNFGNPHMLYLVWVLPLLLLAFLYGWRKRDGILARFAETRMLNLLVPPGTGKRRRIKGALVLAAAVLLVTAMAGPRYGFEWREFERRGVDLVIALDCSRSMLAEDIAPNRLARAKREIVDLLGMLEGDRIGLVAFSGTAFLQCPLTLDYTSFDLFLNVLTPDYLPLGGTDLEAAVRTTISAFDPQSDTDKAVILITDGEHTGRGDPMEAAEVLRKAGIKLFSIGVGGTDGVPVPAAGGGFAKDRDGRIVMSRLDEALLTRMAVTTGGTYVRSVAGDMDLDVIYREGIRGTMTHATLEGGRKLVWAERYQWPLLAAILLLLAARALPARKNALLPLLAAAVLLHAAPGTAGPLQEGYKAYHQGRYEQALEHFIQGQLNNPDSPEVLYNIGNAYYRIGDYPAAQAHYTQALEKAPADLKSGLHYNLGNTAYRLGDLHEAVRNYEAALQLAPDDIQAQENLDFVNKRLQEQQRPQNPDNLQEGDEGDERSDADGPPQPGKKRPPDRNQENKAPEGEQESSPDGSGEDGGENAGRTAADSEPSESEGLKEDRPASPDPAVHMLNRLKDEPGRATMPSYGRQPVDRDW